MSEFKESIAMIMKAMEAMEKRLKSEITSEIIKKMKPEMSNQTNKILSVIESFQTKVEKHERIFNNLKTDIEKD